MVSLCHGTNVGNGIVLEKSMLNVNLKKYITDRVWFGWWYRDFSATRWTTQPPDYALQAHQKYFSTKWVRDPNVKTHREIRMLGRNYDD